VFEENLQKKFEDIFKLKKVTYDLPGESVEQDVLFITINQAKSVIKDTKELSRVEGSCFIYSQRERLKFGYLDKMIQKADPALTKNIFFFNLDTNEKTYQNLIQRGFDFMFFYKNQYDPVKGTITSIAFNQ